MSLVAAGDRADLAAKSKKTDRAHDVLRWAKRSLRGIFHPKNVAVIGASETAGTVGRTLLWNLVSSPFGGTVYPVNPKRASVLGIRACPSIRDVPDQVDLAVIATPAVTVPGIVRECVEAGVKDAIVISAGFREIGAKGQELERKILENARVGSMRIVGPNCLGVMNPLTGLNASFAHGSARPGRVAFVSQSGALCTAILDWSFAEQVGFSAFASLGSMLDVSWGDVIDYLGDDPKTQAILIYMESIGDARAFLSAAREVALNKPIIVIKAGRTPAAAKAAASHTGSLTGSDAVLDAAFKRAGVLRVDTISELFEMAEVFSRQPRPRGPRLAIVTNAGGPGVLATDSLIEAGGALAQLAPDSMARLDELLPEAWSHGNPVDILGDATPDRYTKAVEIASKDPNSDGMLVILTPQDMSEPTQIAERLKDFANQTDRPILASWMGGPLVRAGEDILNRAGIPTFRYPDAAAKTFASMWRHTQNLVNLYETPFPSEAAEKHVDRDRARAILDRARRSGRRLLDEGESKEVLAAYGIPTVPTVVSTTEDEAAEAARKTGFPVVLKLRSSTITHKSDVGGVVLDLRDEASVRGAFRKIRASVERVASAQDFQGVTVQPMIRLEGYELILGSSLDPQFGPVLLFGQGGQLVEMHQDGAIALPPLTETLARRMMGETRIYKALLGVRGRPPVDLAALARIMVRFSQLVVEQPWIAECDINPLLASPEKIVALDARVVLHDPASTETDLPRPAIRPYPIQYTRSMTLKNGEKVTIRLIRPEDEPAMVRFHRMLSERTVRLRYFHPLQYAERVAHQRLLRVCFSDYDRDLPLVAELERPNDKGERDIVAVGRLSKLPSTNRGEFAVLVSDQWQNQGLGSELLRIIVGIAKDEKLGRVVADILPENVEMQHVAAKNGFTLDKRYEEQRVVADLKLDAEG
jgi:acetyltransferase